MLSTPVFLANPTSVTVDALLMAVLASSAAVLAWAFTDCFSSSVRLGAVSIDLFFSARAPSIAAFALTLSIATVPLLTASVTALLDLAWPIACLAAWASASTWPLAAFFSLSVIPLVLSIACFAAFATSSIFWSACFLVFAKLLSPSKASTASFTDLVRSFTWLAESFAPVAARTAWAFWTAELRLSFLSALACK